VPPQPGGAAPLLSLTLALVRIWCGAILVWTGIPKITAGEEWTPRMLGFIGGQAPWPFWQPVLDAVVVPNAALFAVMTAWGELLLGLALILGLGTRLAGALSIVMLSAYWLTKGAHPLSPSNDILMSLALLPVIVAGAGRVLGLDGPLSRRPGWPRWIG